MVHGFGRISVWPDKKCMVTLVGPAMTGSIRWLLTQQQTESREKKVERSDQNQGCTQLSDPHDPLLSARPCILKTRSLQNNTEMGGHTFKASACGAVSNHDTSWPWLDLWSLAQPGR